MEHATPKFVVSRDGTSIAYWTYDGHRDLSPVVFVNGYATNTFYWDQYIPRLPSPSVTWDLRGHGRSGPANDLDQLSMVSCVEDLEAVLDAAGLERATLVAFSLGCQIILEAWRHIPDRISGLIPILGTYKRPFDTVVHPVVGKTIHTALKIGGRRSGNFWMRAAHLATRAPAAHSLNQLFGMVSSDVDNASLQPMYDHFVNIDGPTWIALGLAAQKHTARDVLPTIDVPTLIIGGGKDLLTPRELSYEMRDAIPGAKLVMLEGATHAGLLEQTDAISSHILEFIQNGRSD